ncbi:MAG TPA: monovalent cation/H+ antiporter complex subunit F [Pirellulales bacterium]|nr:monovalent cation/H+ antiporter complex subunit F [Pirellulales bacterium]
MNLWLLGVLLLSLALLPCGAVLLSKPPIDRLLALNLTTTITSLTILLFAAGLGQPSFADLALTVAVLALPAGLVFAHFMERML